MARGKSGRSRPDDQGLGALHRGSLRPFRAAMTRAYHAAMPDGAGLSNRGRPPTWVGWIVVAVVGLAFLGGSFLVDRPPALSAPSPVSTYKERFLTTGSLLTSRSGHAAALLPDGTVLMVG